MCLYHRMFQLFGTLWRELTSCGMQHHTDLPILNQDTLDPTISRCYRSNDTVVVSVVKEKRQVREASSESLSASSSQQQQEPQQQQQQVVAVVVVVVVVVAVVVVVLGATAAGPVDRASDYVTLSSVAA